MVAGSSSDITSAQIDAIKQYFTTFLAAAGVTVSLDVITVSLDGRRRHLLVDNVLRRLAGEVAVEVSITLPQTADESALSSSLATTEVQDNLNSTMASSGLTVTTVSVKDSGGGGTNVGAIVGGVIGGVVGLCLIGALVYMCMNKKKSSVAVKANA